MEILLLEREVYFRRICIRFLFNCICVSDFYRDCVILRRQNARSEKRSSLFADFIVFDSRESEYMDCNQIKKYQKYFNFLGIIINPNPYGLSAFIKHLKISFPYTPFTSYPIPYYLIPFLLIPAILLTPKLSMHGSNS